MFGSRSVADAKGARPVHGGTGSVVDEETFADTDRGFSRAAAGPSPVKITSAAVGTGRVVELINCDGARGDQTEVGLNFARLRNLRTDDGEAAHNRVIQGTRHNRTHERVGQRRGQRVVDESSFARNQGLGRITEGAGRGLVAIDAVSSSRRIEFIDGEIVRSAREQIRDGVVG